MPNLNIAVEIASRGGQAAAGDVNLVSGALGKLQQTAGGIASGLGGVVDGFGRLGLAAAGAKAVADGIVGVATSMVSGNAEMERYEIQLGTLLGGADKARARLGELAKFGAETPFELPEVVRAEKVLLGFGLTGERVLRQTGKEAGAFRTVVGDVAAGTGQRFEDIAATFGRFASGATGEAISRFQELGIATREQLMEMGIEFSKSGELVSPLDEALQATVKIAEQKFGGGMKALSASWEGMWSTLQDSLNQTKIALAAPLFELLKPGLASVNSLLSSDGFQARLRETTEWLAGGITSGLQLAGQAFDALQAPLSRASDLWTTFVGGLQGDWSGRFATDVDGISKAVGTAGQVLGSVGQAIADLIGGTRRDGLSGLVAGMGSVRDVMTEWASEVPLVGGALAALAGNGIDSLTNLVEVAQRVFAGDLAGAITHFLQFQVDSRVQLAENLAGWGQSFLGWVEPMLPGLRAEAEKIGGAIVGFIQSQVPPLVERLAGWGAAFVDFIAPHIAPMLEQAGQLAAGLLGWMGEQVSRLVEGLAPWAASFVDWIGPRIPDLLREAGRLAGSLFEWMVGTALPGIAEKLGQWGLAFVEWVGPRIGPMLVELGKLLAELAGWVVTTAVPRVQGEVGKLAEKFVTWVATDVLPKLPGQLARIGSGIASWAVNEGAPAAGSAIQRVGAAIVGGIQSGISNAWAGLTAWLGEKMRSLAPFAAKQIKAESPSRLFAQIVGETIPGGIALGIDTAWHLVTDALDERIEELLAGAGRAIDELARVMAEGAGSGGESGGSGGGAGGGSGGGRGRGAGSGQEPENTDGQTAPRQYQDDPLYKQLAGNRAHGNTPGKLSMDFGDVAAYNAELDTYRGADKPHPGKSGYYSVMYRVNTLLSNGQATSVRDALQRAIEWVFGQTNDRYDGQLGWTLKASGGAADYSRMSEDELEAAWQAAGRPSTGPIWAEVQRRRPKQYGGEKGMGGWMEDGRIYDVGDRGPERIYMGSRGGYVVPYSGSSGGGGGIDYTKLAAAMAAQPINVVLNGQVVGRFMRDELAAIKRANGSTGL